MHSTCLTLHLAPHSSLNRTSLVKKRRLIRCRRLKRRSHRHHLWIRTAVLHLLANDCRLLAAQAATWRILWLARRKEPNGVGEGQRRKRRRGRGHRVAKLTGRCNRIMQTAAGAPLSPRPRTASRAREGDRAAARAAKALSIRMWKKSSSTASARKMVSGKQVVVGALRESLRPENQWTVTATAKEHVVNARAEIEEKERGVL
mmetsp:Transcript_41487/g.83807  ORF Transcript_41487/g.83807 Transcript_41487/m.83807 type:complete len:203 (+) Transcript_41487:971-1579(+)